MLLSPVPLSLPWRSVKRYPIPNCQDAQGDFTTWFPCSINWISSNLKASIDFVFSNLTPFILSCKLSTESLIPSLVTTPV